MEEGGATGETAERRGAGPDGGHAGRNRSEGNTGPVMGMTGWTSSPDETRTEGELFGRSPPVGSLWLETMSLTECNEMISSCTSYVPFFCKLVGTGFEMPHGFIGHSSAKVTRNLPFDLSAQVSC